MKKIMAVSAVLMMVSSVAFAAGSANKKTIAYGDCIVKSPVVCGGYRANMTAEEFAAFRACTDKEQKKCYDAYIK